MKTFYIHNLSLLTLYYNVYYNSVSILQLSKSREKHFTCLNLLSWISDRLRP